MERKELPTIRRFAEIGVKKLNFKNEDLRKMHHAFEKLLVLKKIPIPERMSGKKEVFDADKPLYQERMKWINDFMKSKGYCEDIFRDLDSFESSSDDYDYYYELKTPKQLIEEEEARKKAIKLRE